MRSRLALRGVVAIAVLAASAVFAGPASATTLTVTNTNDSGTGSLRAAIGAAQDGDTVTFAPSVTGTIYLNSTIFMAHNISIVGNGGSPTVSGQNKVRIFVILNVGQTVSMSGFALIDGLVTEVNDGGAPAEGAAINANYADLTLSHMRFSGNNASDSAVSGAGGAVFLSTPSRLRVSDSTFTTNTVGRGSSLGEGSGGAIFSNGDVTITDSTFSGNIAYGNGNEASGGGGLGGAVYVAPFNGSGTITGSTFTGNQVTGGASEGAGAVLAGRDSKLINSTFTQNSAGPGNNGGAGAYFTNGGSIIGDTIDGNTAGGDGTGGIFASNPTLFHNTIVSGNTNANGSANCRSFGGAVVGGGSSYNLEDDAGKSCGFDLPAADPLLGPLAANGGHTQTQELRIGSPAIDAVPAAQCPTTTDQRGLTRPDGSETACDVGAFEVQDTTTTVSAPASAMTNTAIPASSISATLSGSTAGADGSISFKVFGPQSQAPSDCSGGTPVGTVTVSGYGTYHPAAGFTPSQSGTYWWYASYSGDGPNAASGSGCGSGMTSTVVASAPDLSLTGSGSPNPVVSGQHLTYTLTVTNTGGATAANVTLTDALPSSVHFDSVSPSQGSCARSTVSTNKTKDGTVTCTLGSMGPKNTATVAIVVTPTKPGNLSASASVTGTDPTGTAIPTDSDDSATVANTVQGG